MPWVTVIGELGVPGDLLVPSWTIVLQGLRARKSTTVTKSLRPLSASAAVPATAKQGTKGAPAPLELPPELRLDKRLRIQMALLASIRGSLKALL